MRLKLDLDLCQGHGVCCEESPETFEMEGERVRVLESEPPAERHAAVRLAVKYCPTRALTIAEEE